MPYTRGTEWCAHAADNAHLHLIHVGCGHHCAGTRGKQLLDLHLLSPHSGTLPAYERKKDSKTRCTAHELSFVFLEFVPQTPSWTVERKRESG